MTTEPGVSAAHLELIRKAAVGNDLGEYAEQLQKLARPSVILATSTRDESEIPIGATRIGGWPDVPESFAWPFWERIPLTFLGQINLAEMAPFQLGLPDKGLLSFFFCFEGGMDTTREQASGAGVVLYFCEDSLSRAEAPQRAPEPFESCAVRCISYPSLPPAYADRLDELWGLDFLTDGDLTDAYLEVLHHIDETLGVNQLSSEGCSYHQLLGLPSSRAIHSHRNRYGPSAQSSLGPFTRGRSANFAVGGFQELHLLAKCRSSCHSRRTAASA